MTTRISKSLRVWTATIEQMCQTSDRGRSGPQRRLMHAISTGGRHVLYLDLAGDLAPIVEDVRGAAVMLHDLGDAGPGMKPESRLKLGCRRVLTATCHLDERHNCDQAAADQIGHYANVVDEVQMALECGELDELIASL